MGVTPETLNRVIAVARGLEARGYFEKARQGDQRAASLFARLVAYGANPAGHTSDFGWLSKSPGESQVDGYAEDAIVYGNDPSDRQNVVDLVNGAGAPNASIGGSVKERREHNRWVKPVALTDEELRYLQSGGQPVPVPPPTPILKPRDQFAGEFARLNAYYAAPEGLQRVGGMVSNVDASVFAVIRRIADGSITDSETIRNACAQVLAIQCDAQAMAAWGYDLMTGATVEQCIARIRQSGEWQAKHHGETP